jgi:hypothetical protein
LASGIVVTPFLGNLKTQEGHKDGPALEAEFGAILGRLCQDAQGNIYIPDRIYATNRSYLRKLSVDGRVTTVAGVDEVSGFRDGPVSIAKFNNISACAIDAQGNIYLADSGNFRIRKITPEGMVSTFAGSGKSDFDDGPPEQASFQFTQELLLDADHHRLILNMVGPDVREIDLQTGYVKTIFNFYRRLIRLDDKDIFRDYYEVNFSSSTFLAYNSQDDIFYVSDNENRAIRQIQNNRVTTLAGGRRGDIQDSYREYATFNQTGPLVFDPERKQLYEIDAKTFYDRIRIISLAGRVSSLNWDSQDPDKKIKLGGISSLFLQDHNHLIVGIDQNPEGTLTALFYRITLPDGAVPEIY